jgi:hypothetical protein
MEIYCLLILAASSGKDFFHTVDHTEYRINWGVLHIIFLVVVITGIIPGPSFMEGGNTSPAYIL